MYNKTVTEVDEEAEREMESLIQDLLKAMPLPGTEKTLERAQHMTMIYQTAEEIIRDQIVLRIR
jgi:hypothetical protein